MKLFSIAKFGRTAPCVLVITLLTLAAFTLAAAAQSAPSTTGSCPTTTGNNVCLTTFQGAPSRMGQNTSEGTLTQAAITAATGTVFEKLYSTAVNGAVYGQPLILPNVVIKKTTYTDVAFVVTEQDWVYAINGANGKVIWSVNLVPKGYTYLDSTTDLNGCTTILPTPGYVGITGTPVIDISQNVIGTANTITTGTMYLVARTKTTTSPVTFVQTIYALDITTGNTKASTVIGGTYKNGPVSIAWDSAYAQTQNQRGALLAVPETGANPQIIITWAASCDLTNFPYNGWMMAYQLNSAGSALTQSAIWLAVPSDTTYEGGIWQGGSGPAGGNGGHIFVAVGNGDANTNTSVPPNDAPTSCATTPCDYGQSVLNFELTGSPPTFTVEDFFTAFDWKTRNNKDYDLGAGGVMLLPFQSAGNPQNLLAQAGKEGSIYLLNSNKGYLGGYNGGNADQVAQYIPNVLCYSTTTECGVWGAPAWWTTTSGGSGSSGYAYWGSKNEPLMQFKFYPNGNTCTGTGTTAGFCKTATASTAHKFGWPGPTPTVSSPSASSLKAIVWAIDAGNASNGGGANLWAFDAATLDCLFTTSGSATSCTRVSSANAPKGVAVKYTVPSVANGQVYVGSASSTGGGYLNIYGLN